jgi:hypothetical protein
LKVLASEPIQPKCRLTKKLEKRLECLQKPLESSCFKFKNHLNMKKLEQKVLKEPLKYEKT